MTDSTMLPTSSSLTRRRSGSLELDYGDDPLQDQMSSDQPPRSPPQPSQPEIKPIATLEASKVTFNLSLSLLLYTDEV